MADCQHDFSDMSVLFHLGMGLRSVPEIKAVGDGGANLCPQLWPDFLADHIGDAGLPFQWQWAKKRTGDPYPPRHDFT